MPACSNCAKSQSKLNVGDLCRDCFTRANNNGNTTTGNDCVAGINIEKPLGELCVGIGYVK